MTDKEFKKLSRAELIEIIYQLQKKEKLYLDEIEKLQKEADLKQLKIKDAGSIAEAVVGLSDIFEQAQKIADKYLDEVHAANSDVEERANKIIADAEAKAAMIKANAELEAENKWKSVNEKVSKLLQAHSELSSLLGK